MTAGGSGQGLRNGPVGLDRREEVALPFPFFDITDWFFSSAKPRKRRSWTARRLFGLASSIAGSRRTALRSSAVLAELPPREAVIKTAGMVMAALRLRASDAARACWWPADRVLASRALSNILVAAPTLGATWALFQHGGGIGVIENTEAVAVIGGAVRGLVTLGRRWRDVAPPEWKTQSGRPQPEPIGSTENAPSADSKPTT